MDENYVPRGREDVLYRTLRDGCTLYDTKSSKVHLLNLTAAYIWTYCDGRFSIAQIASKLQDDFDIGEGTSLCHVKQTIEGFLRKGLLCDDSARV